MKSMTGFGQGRAGGEGLHVQVELGSVNRKSLDVHFSLPRELNALEATCQKRIAESCARGRVQVKILVERSGGAEVPVTLNEAQAREWLKKLNTFAGEEGLAPVSSVVDVLRFPKVVTELSPGPEEIGSDSEVRPLLEQALDRALAELSIMREREGTHLREILQELSGELKQTLETITPLLPEAREALALKIRGAVEGLGALSPEMQNRVLQEIALQAERSDVQEEVDRLRGHLQQFDEKLARTEPVGRALDFLCQEMARELNTLSVKASRADINQLALAGKETVEKIREQVQNVE